MHYLDLLQHFTTAFIIRGHRIIKAPHSRLPAGCAGQGQKRYRFRQRNGTKPHSHVNDARSPVGVGCISCTMVRTAHPTQLRYARPHGAGFGYTLCTATIFSSTSAAGVTSAPSRFSCICCTLVAPSRTLLVNQRVRAKASAICPGLNPASRAMAHILAWRHSAGQMMKRAKQYCQVP